jgi:hypothetical protein
MTLRRSDYAEAPARNLPSITLPSGREISKTSLFNVLQAGGWTAAYVVCSFAAAQMFGLWPALLIGMDAIGLLDVFIIDYRRRELQMRTRPGGV